MDFSFTAKLRLRKDGKTSAARHFVSVPDDISQEIRKMIKAMGKNTWGIRSVIRIWFITRETSIFYTKEKQIYLLPIKADIRKQLHIKAEDTIHINLQII